MKKLLVAAVAATFVLTGCNAIKGLGKDISKSGQVVSNTAQEVSQEIAQH